MNESSNGRILGIDAGERRIGVAISDPGGSFALPLESVFADGHEFEALRRLIETEGVTSLVVGLPLSMSGEASDQTARAQAFATNAAERLGLPVEMWDERLSSREAERLTSYPPQRESKGRGGRGRNNPKGSHAPDTDAMAASIILQAYLDSRRFERI